jgi:hypothetical protein
MASAHERSWEAALGRLADGYRRALDRAVTADAGTASGGHVCDELALA